MNNKALKFYVDDDAIGRPWIEQGSVWVVVGRISADFDSRLLPPTTTLTGKWELVSMEVLKDEKGKFCLIEEK